MSEMKRLESRPFRAGVTEEMGGTLAGRRRRRRIRSAWSGLCVGVGGVAGVGVDWKHSHGNRRRHGPHLKLIQSGRDTQT